MKRQCFVIAALLAGLSALPAAGGTESAGEKELTDIAERAAKVAEEYLAGPQKGEPLADWTARRPMDPYLDSLMRGIWYDEKSIPALVKAIQTPRKDPAVHLYGINRLVKPMLMAKTEVIRKALPLVKAVRKPSRQYRQLPRYGQGELKGFQDVPNASGKDKERLRQRRLEKMKRELAIAFYNEQLGRFNQTMYRLMVYADQEAKDRELTALMVAAEADRQWDYTVILEAIRAEAQKMSQERAKRFYRELRPIWQRLRPQGAQMYEDRTAPQLRLTGNSTFARQKDAAGNRVLKAINQLAATAKEPALQNPRPRKTPPRPKPSRPRKKTQ